LPRRGEILTGAMGGLRFRGVKVCETLS